ncbi:S9 family peptidase [Yinghuangia aomiensis]|uniref:S9 family peptidase n=1 Tax=Yinghuangia aomiensis TaxID=676205 RepID=UPI0031EB5A5F
MAVDRESNPWIDHHRRKAARFLDRLQPLTDALAARIAAMTGFPFERPGFPSAAGTVFGRGNADGTGAQLVFRDTAGDERILVEPFIPSMEYPGIYPNGFWVSPDGLHVVYSDANPIHEGDTSLHMVRTDTGAEVGTPLVGASRPSGSWISPDTFVYSLYDVGGRDDGRHVRAAGWTTYVRRLHQDGTVHDERLTEGEREGGNSRYDFVPGPFAGSVVVISYSHIINTPTGIHVVDLTGSGRGYAVQEESEGVLGRVRVGPVEADGTRRLFLLKFDGDRTRSGRILEVGPPPPGESRARLTELIPERPGDVIREFEVIDRGAGRTPALALSVRRNGAEVRVDIVDLKSDDRTPGDAAASAGGGGHVTAGDRWTVDLPGQEMTSATPGVVVEGKFGAITAMTATAGDGRGGVDIEYSSPTIPLRLYRLHNTEDRHAEPQLVVGPTDAQLREAGVPEIDVSLHRVATDDGRTTWLHMLRPAGVAPDEPLPTVETAYPYYDLGPTANFRPQVAVVVDAGIAYVNHQAYGGGADGRGDQPAAKADGRAKALLDLKAGFRYLDGLPGVQGRAGRTLTFASAGGMTAVGALRHATAGFRNAVISRPYVNPLSLEGSSHDVHMDVGDPADRRAGYEASGPLPVEPHRMPENTVWVVGRSDPRIPPHDVRRTAAAFEAAEAEFHGDKLKRPGTLMIEQDSSGHFPGGKEVAVMSGMLIHLSGRHPVTPHEPNRTPLSPATATTTAATAGLAPMARLHEAPSTWAADVKGNSKTHALARQAVNTEIRTTQTHAVAREVGRPARRI